MSTVVFLFFLMSVDQPFITLKASPMPSVEVCEKLRDSFTDPDMVKRSFCASVTTNVEAKEKGDDEKLPLMKQQDSRAVKEAHSCHPPQAFYSGKPCREA